MKRDPRIDAYIVGKGEFARPILEKVRERVHAAAPLAEEGIKWGAPAFLVDGKILLIMAAFKAHAALNFWRSQELRGTEADAEGMGQFGKLTSIADLPPDAEFDRLIREAVDLARSAPAPRKTKQAPKAEPTLHPSFANALAAAPKAKAALDGFPPLSPARLSRMDLRGEAGRHAREAHNNRHRMAQRRQTPALEISELLIATVPGRSGRARPRSP